MCTFILLNWGVDIGGPRVVEDTPVRRLSNVGIEVPFAQAGFIVTDRDKDDIFASEMPPLSRTACKGVAMGPVIRNSREADRRRALVLGVCHLPAVARTKK